MALSFTTYPFESHSKSYASILKSNPTGSPQPPKHTGKMLEKQSKLKLTCKVTNSALVRPAAGEEGRAPG